MTEFQYVTSQPFYHRYPCFIDNDFTNYIVLSWTIAFISYYI